MDIVNAETQARVENLRSEANVMSIDPAVAVDAAWDVVWKFVKRPGALGQLMSKVDGVAQARAFQSGYDTRESLAFFEKILGTAVENSDPDHICLSPGDRTKVERAARIYRAALHWHIGHPAVERVR